MRAHHHSCGASSTKCASGRNLAFTLVELLVVIAILTVLISLLVPALSMAQAQAKSVQCASNLRQICIALTAYAADYKGNYPPNSAAAGGPQYWYDADRIGRYLRTPVQPTRGGISGGVMACPADDDATRSYSMNIWASSKIDYVPRGAPLGTLWRHGVRNSSQMILVAEKWSTAGSARLGWLSTATLGLPGTPGQRFGGGTGIPLWSSGRLPPVNCELPFQRHRLRGGKGVGLEPKGRVHLGYADGHVSLKSDSELVDHATGLSTLDSWWSPLDPILNQ